MRVLKFYPLFVTLIVGMALSFVGCRAPSPSVPTVTSVAVLSEEVAVVPISLAGPLNERRVEVSGMAWYSDTLVILPQYPDRFEGGGEDGALFVLSTMELRSAIAGEASVALTPQIVPFNAHGVRDAVKGFEGYEAIAFSGDRVFLTIEASPGDRMVGYLISGIISPDLQEVRLDVETLTPIQPQAELSNMSDESLVVAGGSLLTLYEAYGANVNPDPVAHRFSQDLTSPSVVSSTVPFPQLEYRVTDATALDGEGQFWVTNCFWPGDREKLRPATDSLAEKFGLGSSHLRSETVERLVELRYTGTEITFTNSALIQFKLLGEDARNWEAVVRFDDGFLLMTDTHPETILAFVPLPGED